MSNRIKVYHFHNGMGGGVLSVIRNLLKYKQHENIENHVIYTINKDVYSDYQLPFLEGANTEQVFYYSPDWNFYYTCKQLSLLFPADAILIAHDWLELGMTSALGLPNKIIHLLHGDYDYYYNLMKKHLEVTDMYLCVSEAIKNKVQDDELFSSHDVKRFYLPVPDVHPKIPYLHTQKIIFMGRFEKAKGYHLLPNIAHDLAQAGIQLHWDIFGEKKDIENIWPKNVDIKVQGFLDNRDLLKKLNQYDYFILPSLAEGMPVTLIEAMKAGLVPIVNDLQGIDELVEDGVTGFKVKNNDVKEYVRVISYLQNNPKQKEVFSKAGVELSNSLFDPKKNTNNFEEWVIQLSKSLLIAKSRKRVYGSTLDQIWLPNFITFFCRKLIKIFRRK